MTRPAKVDTERFPFQIGKYWLGPMDPNKPPPMGGFGYAMAGIDSETGERVCAKINHNMAFEDSAAQHKEIVVQAMLQHEGIVSIKDVLKEVPPQWNRHVGQWILRPDGRPMTIIVMEMMSGGELFDEVAKPGVSGLSEATARFYLRQILLALAYCHGRGIAHRDIKLENILLSADKKSCKIVDFGCSKISTGKDQTLLGTIQYAAPEMFTGTSGCGYDHRVADMWALGVCLFAMTEKKLPFKSALVRAIGKQAAEGGFGGHGVTVPTRTDTACMRAICSANYKLKSGSSAEIHTFLARLLNVDPATRYTAAQALHDPWILGTDWSTQHVDELLIKLDRERAAMAAFSLDSSEKDSVGLDPALDFEDAF